MVIDVKLSCGQMPFLTLTREITHWTMYFPYQRICMSLGGASRPMFWYNMFNLATTASVLSCNQPTCIIMTVLKCPRELNHNQLYILWWLSASESTLHSKLQNMNIMNCITYYMYSAYTCHSNRQSLEWHTAHIVTQSCAAIKQLTYQSI